MISPWRCFIRITNIFVSPFEANTNRVCDLCHFTIYEFKSWLQVTLLMHQHVVTLHSWLVHRLSASTLFFHLSHGTSVYKSSLGLHLRLVPRSPFLAIFTLSSHSWVTSYWASIERIISSILWTLLECHLDITAKINQALVWFSYIHIWTNSNMVKPIHDSSYLIHFGLTNPLNHFNLYYDHIYA